MDDDVDDDDDVGENESNELNLDGSDDEAVERFENPGGGSEEGIEGGMMMMGWAGGIRGTGGGNPS